MGDCGGGVDGGGVGDDNGCEDCGAGGYDDKKLDYAGDDDGYINDSAYDGYGDDDDDDDDDDDGDDDDDDGHDGHDGEEEKEEDGDEDGDDYRYAYDDNADDDGGY